MCSSDLIPFLGIAGAALFYGDSVLTPAISVLSARFNKTAFLNIVEEPEQNLFPSSQWDLLKSLLAFNSLGAHNRLVLTTHSPYIVNFLSLAIQGKHLQQRLIACKSWSPAWSPGLKLCFSMRRAPPKTSLHRQVMTQIQGKKPFPCGCGCCSAV